MTGSNLYLNYVNGQWIPASTGKVSQSVNPADLDDVIGDFQASNAVDAEGAVGAAADAGRAWGSMSALARGGLLLAAADYLNQNSERYAQAITRECGKAIIEARGEVGRAVALLQYFGVEGSNPVGDVVPSVDPNILLYTKRVPIGVVSLITPWNFPLAIPIWKMAPALVYGNTIVLKPASATPRLGVLIAEMWDAVGLPPGVFQSHHRFRRCGRRCARQFCRRFGGLVYWLDIDWHGHRGESGEKWREIPTRDGW